MATVLVLGGGFGGIIVGSQLRRLVAPEHRIVVIERKQKFSLCLSNLWVMTGERETPADGERELSKLGDWGIEWVHADIETIDPAAKTVRTTAGNLQGDYIVMALGAEKNPQTVPGFAESALNLYELAGAQRIRSELERFSGGRVVVLISRTPFSCPAAPYEAAFLIDSVLRERGIRQRTEIAVYTPEDQPMPVAGPAVGSALIQMLEARNIEFHGEQIVLKIEPASRRVLFEINETPFDLLIGVPPHSAPQAVRESGLTDASGWVPVDPTSLQTRFDSVLAIGDMTAIRLPNGMFLPKAGVFADSEARIVAENIAAAIGGAAAPSSKFNGDGFCYIEVGGGMAAYGSGHFYAMPGPRIALEAPSQRYRREKGEFERTVLALWD